MNYKFVFIYDGQCPFCNKFAELLELKSGIPDLQIKNARENPPELPDSYDMDKNGAILLIDDDMFFGSKAINWICSEVKEPSDILLKSNFEAIHETSDLLSFNVKYE